MKNFVLAEPRDYLALVVRRRWWTIVPFVLVTLAVALVAYSLPSVYVSETLILVEPREVPDEFVKNLLSVDTHQRLDAVTQRILSRTNLLRIFNEFETDLALLRRLNDEQKVRQLSSDIGIQSETGRGTAAYFTISYAHRNPEVAQKIASRLASLFIEYDNRTREEQVFGTTEFLESELQKVSTRLKEVTDALANFKERFRHQLPDQLETNLRTLDRLYIQLQAGREALDRSTGRRLDLERQISETSPVIIESIHSPTTSSSATGQRGPSPLVQEYWEKEQRLADLTARYTDIHPDVRRLRAELARLKDEIPPSDFLQIQTESDNGTWDTVTKPNPVYQQLTNQLSEINREISIRRSEQERIEAQIETYQQRVQSAPQREQEMGALNREYEELNLQYQSLSNKLNESRLAESLESRQKGEQFVVLDAANYPLQPARPNRWAIFWMGLLCSLGMGVGIAVAADFMDQKLWTHSEVERLLGLPVLAEIPEIVTECELRQRRKKRWVRSLAALALITLLVGGLYVAYLEPDLRNPVQRYFLRSIDSLASYLNW